MAPVLTDLKNESAAPAASTPAQQTQPNISFCALNLGASDPLGATVHRNGVGFSLFSRYASSVDLLFFDHEDDAQPACVITIDPETNRTYHYWHLFVPGIKPGQIYGYRVHGPFDPASGLRFDSSKVLLDPYGRGVVVPKKYDREVACQPGDHTAAAMKNVVIDPDTYDWEGDTPLKRPSSQAIVYEMHLRGFTRHPSSGVSPEIAGTYRGLIEKIPYLQQLGITAVELLPVFQFDAQDCPSGLVNYWGYQPISFFAPHRAYSSQQGPHGPNDEFRDMVKALHRAGIEVILDVVFNHTAEGDQNGPTMSFRGIDNSAYYILDNDRSRYLDFSGCGNTFNTNHPATRRLIEDSLRYWVREMHVDGFRFDLASILARDSNGCLLANPPVLWDIESDPALAGVKVIAEAWDAAGLYQVGSFVGDSWREWNGLFRDDVRSFYRSDNGMVRRFADRILGSSDLYSHKQREAEQSVNFVTCHDGFTLNDIVSYNQKHNEANGEENRDGGNDNRSSNYGIEGPTDDPAIEALRHRQVKNFLAITLLSLGMPMILMGDEVRRTQHGNNNAYCHDDENVWFDWTLVEKHPDLIRFVQRLAASRLFHSNEPALRRKTLAQRITQGFLGWHGVRLNEPDWGDTSHSIAFTADLAGEGRRIYVINNAYWEPLDFKLPHLTGGDAAWHRWIDTSLDSPNDVVDWWSAPPVSDHAYHAGPRSMVALWTEAQINPQQD